MFTRPPFALIFTSTAALSGCAPAVFSTDTEPVALRIESTQRRTEVMVRDAQNTQHCMTPCGVTVLPGSLALSTEWNPYASTVIVPSNPSRIAIESRDGVAVAGLFTLLASESTLLAAGVTFGVAANTSFTMPKSPNPTLVTATEVLDASELSLLAIGLLVMGFSAPNVKPSAVNAGEMIDVQPRVLIHPAITESAMGIVVQKNL